MDETRQVQWFRRELAQTSQQFEEKVRELLAVRRVWDSLKFTRDSRKVFEAVLDIIVDETSATCASLLLVNLKNGQLTLRTTRGRVPEGTLSHLLMDERIAEAVANSRKPTSIPDLSATRPGGPSGTLFCVPLLIDEQVVGVIHLYHSDPHAFSEDDERVMTVIADQVAVALNSAQIFDEMQQFNALLEAEVAKATEELRRTNADLEGQITERLRAEAALRERERQLEELNASLEERVRLRTLELQVLYERIDGLVRHLPEGVFLLDEDLRLIIANPAARAFLAELASAEVGQVISEIGGQRLETLLEPRKGDLPYELTMEAPSGKRIFEIRARSISEGRIGGGWVVVLREVTREREALERMQQQDRLATVGQLAAGIAHDFNNLLMGIIGLAELLEMRPDIPESARGNLSRIVTQGERGAQLIRQILDFSRKSFVEQQAIDLVPFIQEAVPMLRRTLPEPIRVTVDYGGGEYRVRANPTQLQQVITNLAVNARDAMPGGGEIRIAFSRLRLDPEGQTPLPDMRPGDWVVWTVCDTGAGIPREVMEHVFEPFYTTKETGKGTGLGLSQVYGIIKQHGGEITVSSDAGKGAIFTMYLPLLSPEPASPEVGGGSCASRTRQRSFM